MNSSYNLLVTSLMLAFLAAATPLLAQDDETSSGRFQDITASQCDLGSEVNPEIKLTFQSSDLMCTVPCDGVPDPHAFCRDFCQGEGYSGGACLRDLGTICSPYPQDRYCLCV